jgi:hypothetical protein
MTKIGGMIAVLRASVVFAYLHRIWFEADIKRYFKKVDEKNDNFMVDDT